MYTYLASPYTHKDARVRKQRHEDVARVASVFLLHDEIIYSPVLHFHYIAVKYDLPYDHKFWEKHNIAMLLGAKDLVIAKIKGWETSAGVRREYEFAREHNMPVFESRSAESYKVSMTEEPW